MSFYRTAKVGFAVVALIGLFLVNLSPLQAQDKMRKGQEFIEQEDFEKAAKVFKEITDENPDDGRAWFMLGYALHAGGKLEEAIKAHKKAADFDEMGAVATYNLGCAYSLQHKKDEAIKALQNAVEIGFSDLNQFKIDSDLYALHTDVRFAKIMADLDGDLKTVKKLDEAESFLGKQEFAKAAEIYKAITESDDENHFAWYRLGYALHGAGELDEALKVHTKASKFPGVGPIATYNIACVHSLRDDKDEAFEFLTKAVKKGFHRLDAFENDPDLDNIRSDERFQEIVKKIKAHHEEHGSEKHGSEEHGSEEHSKEHKDGDKHEHSSKDKKDHDG